MYDTASLNGLVSGKAATGTLSFKFFSTINCSDTGVAAGSSIALTGHSSTEVRLRAAMGSRRSIVAGTNDNYSSSVWGSCEPLTISPGAVTVSTVIKNAADDSTVTGALALGSSVYDTASLNGLVSGKAATGTLSFKFFSTINCSDTGVAAGSSIALTGHSSTEGPLAAGSYGFEAQYVAGTNDNYSSSVWGSCEPLTISPGAVTVSTVIKNAADDSTVTGALALGSSVYDTASLNGLVSGKAATGTLSFKFFSTINCSDTGVAAGSSIALTGHSSTEGPLAAGSYGFEAQYVAGTNDNYSSSVWGSCEPLTISPGAVTVSTVIKNAADDSTVTGALALGSSVYDTASLNGLVSGKAATGTLSFKFFSTINCSDTGVAAGSSIALTGHSSTEGPLAAGSYGFEAQYVAGTNDNYSSSVWGSCEPLTISPGAVTVSTVIKNAADDSTVTGALALGSSVYDTASLNGLVSGKAATGTLSFRFFTGADCSVDNQVGSTQTGVALDGQSSTQGPLGAGSYSFDSQYVAGTSDNYTTSDWSSCEPLTISPGTVTVDTTLKNGADDSTVENGTTLSTGSSVYDTASVNGLADGQDPTGTLSYRFFNTIGCSDEPVGSGSGLALTDPSNTQGPLNAGDYGFEAQYVAGTNDNYTTSDWSSCEPFTIAKATPTIGTTPSAGGNVGVVLNDSADLSGGYNDEHGHDHVQALRAEQRDV